MGYDTLFKHVTKKSVYVNELLCGSKDILISFVLMLMIPRSTRENLQLKTSLNKYSHIPNTDGAWRFIAWNVIPLFVYFQCSIFHNINDWICNLTTSVRKMVKVCKST